MRTSTRQVAQKRTSRGPKQAALKAAIGKALEPLETRRMLATYTVDDSGGADFLLIQDAINAAVGTAERDTINVAAGTYNENLNINTDVELLGAQVGVLAPTRSGAESIINGTGGMAIGADNIEIDGFTIQGQTNPNIAQGFGAAIRIVPSTVDGSQINNNIIQNNIVGIFLANEGTTQAVISGNLFRDNTNPGPGSGQSIYADEFTAGNGGVENVLITDNTFTNTNPTTNSWALGLSNTNPGVPFTNVTFSDNTVTNHGRGVYAYNTTGLSVTGNDFTVERYALGLFDSGSTATATGNDITITQSGRGFFLSDPGSTITASGNTFNIVTPEDMPFTINPDGSSIDSFGQPMPPGTGTVTNSPTVQELTYTPPLDFNGMTSFAFDTADGTVGTINVTVTPTNDTPTAVNDSFTAVEDGADVTGNVITNDTGNDAPIMVIGISDSNENDTVADGNGDFQLINPNGVLKVNQDGTVSWNPPLNFAGTRTFNYTISDDGGVTSSTATVTITVTAVNDAPTITAPAGQTVAEDTSTQITGISTADPDGNGGVRTLTLAVTSGTLTVGGAGGTVSGNGTGTVIVNGTVGQLNNRLAALFFQSAPDSTAPVTLSINVNDNGNIGTGGPLQANASVAITVTNTPDAPDAMDDTYSATEDLPLMVAAPGVLSNDTDDDGDTLTVTSFTQPTNGVVVVDPDGSFTYTPTGNFNGTDTFTYTIDDGNGGMDTATVTINVGSVNDAQTATPDSGTVAEDVSLSDTLAGTDVDGDDLDFAIVSGPTNGTISSFDPETGAFTYTPNANYNGPDSFTFTATDGAATSSAATYSITVTPVNDAPVANNDSYTTNEDTVLNANGLGGNPTGVGTNDSDAETPSSALTYTKLTDPTNGTVVFNSNGTFTYTPNGNYNGPDSFTYRANDGMLNSNVATVSITVNAVNDLPDAVNDTNSTAEDTPASGNVLANDTDPDNVTPTPANTGLRVTSVTGTSGTTTIPNGGTVSNIAVTGGTLSMSSNGAYTFTPTLNSTTTGAFSYAITDDATPTAGTDTASVSITVTAVNDAPTATSALAATALNYAENQAPTPVYPDLNLADAESNNLNQAIITVTGFVAGQDQLSFSAPVPTGFTVNGVTAGNTFSTTSTGTITVLSTNPTTGGTLAAYQAFLRTFQYANLSENPATTARSVGLTVRDVGTPNATSLALNRAITVTATNDPPVAVNDTYAINEDTTLNANGSGGNPSGVGGNDSDAETPSSSLTFTKLSDPANGMVTFNPNGTFTYTPNANFFGTDSFTYRASDGMANSNIATVTITVNAVNDTPVITVPATQMTNEDTNLNVSDDLGVTDSNDGQNLTVTLSLSESAPGAGSGPAAGVLLVTDPDGAGTGITVTGSGTGNVTIMGSAALMNTALDSLIYDPGNNYFGTATVGVTATDGVTPATPQSFNINVVSVNDDPIAVNDTATVLEDSTNEIVVLDDDSDPDGGTVTITSVGTPSQGGTATIDTNGPGPADDTITYTPAANFSGTETFTYTISDGQGGTATATVTVTVTPVNDTPVATPDSGTVAEDGTLTDTLAGTDVDGGDLDFAIVDQPDFGTITSFDGETGAFTYQPNANYNGPDSFTFTATDGTATSSAATYSITVTPENDTPVATPDSGTVAEDGSLTDTLAGTDNDGGDLDFAIVSGPTNGTITSFDGETGTFTYVPNANYNGPDSFTFTATDGTATSSAATYSITVTAVNDAPVANDDTYAATEDVPLTVAAPGVLGNDTDIDGNSLTVSAFTQPTVGTGSVAMNPNGGFTYTPAPNFFGTTSFTYTANDGNGGTDTATVTINVAQESFRVTSIVYNPSGFEVNFSSEYNQDLNLYGDPSDILVFDGTNFLTGSLFFTDADTVTWVKTGGGASGPTKGVFAAGTYMITLESGSSAFRRAADGAALDGNSDGTAGDDFVDNETFGAPGRVLSVQDFSRARNQALAFPTQTNQSSTGLHVILSEGAGAFNVDFWFNYDPAILNITSITAGPDMPGNWSIETNMGSMTQIPGQIRVTASGGTALTAGVKDLFQINGSVAALTPGNPPGGQYGIQHLIRLTNVEVGGDAAVGDSAVHSASYVGDANRSRSYSGADATLISQATVGSINGFSAYPRTDPIVIGDANNSGTLSGADASLVSREAVGTDTVEIPAPTTGARPGANGPDLVSDFVTSPGSFINAPGAISGTGSSANMGIGVTSPAPAGRGTALMFQVRFDATSLTIDPTTGVQATSAAIARGLEVVGNIRGNGNLWIVVYGAQSLGEVTSALFNLTFRQLPGASASSIVRVRGIDEISERSLNETVTRVTFKRPVKGGDNVASSQSRVGAFLFSDELIG